MSMGKLRFGKTTPNMLMRIYRFCSLRGLWLVLVKFDDADSHSSCLSCIANKALLCSSNNVMNLVTVAEGS